MEPRTRGPVRSSSGSPWILLALVFALVAAGCAAGPGVEATAPDAPLDTRVEGVLARPELAGIHWGILAIDADDGRVLHERNAHMRFVPASNMKLPVTAAALALLGPEYRYRTAFLARHPPDERGRIQGDLILEATGDPSLGDPFHESATAALEALVATLEDAGVRSVEGALVVDAAAWDSTTVPGSWMVGNLSATYGATGGAFSVGTGVLEISVVGTSRSGEPARITWEPLGTDDFVENRVTTVAPVGPDAEEQPALRTAYRPESRRWVVEGAIPVDGVQRLTRAQRDPVRQASHALLRVLEGQGIHVDRGVRIVWDPTESPVIASGGTSPSESLIEVAAVESPPLAEIVRAILEPSQNWMTEQLVRTLGAERGEGGSWSDGLAVIADLLEEELGIEPTDIHLRDGSGLSAYNLLTPRAVVRILTDARSRPWAETYRDAMAEPGRSGTTLSSRLTDLEGRVFAKTGTISHVNALSGYLVADDGREIVFSIMTNASNLPAQRVRSAMDDVVRELARR